MLTNKTQKFDPDLYTVSIRKEIIDNKYYFVGRVAELPDLVSYEATYEDAHAIILDAIQTSKEIYDERNIPFPLPFQRATSEFNGRITLRLPRTLHAQISYLANTEEVSINQYLASAIAFYVGNHRNNLLMQDDSRDFLFSNLDQFPTNNYVNNVGSSALRISTASLEHLNFNNFNVNLVKPNSKLIDEGLLLAA